MICPKCSEGILVPTNLGGIRFPDVVLICDHCDHQESSNQPDRNFNESKTNK